MENNSAQSLEELAKHHGWDAELSRLLCSLPRESIEQYIRENVSYDKDGWRYLLPGIGASASVLCLDTRFGNTAAAFAETGATITVIHPCAVTTRILQHRLASLGVLNANATHVPPSTVTLPFADESFDAFIHHDVTGTLTQGSAPSSGLFAGLSPPLIHEVIRLLKPDGFAYFGVKNRHGYAEWQQMFRRSAGMSRPRVRHMINVRRAKRLIRQAGFQDLRCYPYLVERGRVCEVLPASGYHSAKNSFAASEKIKQVVLGKIGSRFLSPAYGLVCAKGRVRPCRLLNFAKNLVAQNILADFPENYSCFRRYLPLHGKVFVTLGKAATGDENIIIVIPKLTKVLTWRRREIAIVNEVRVLSPALAAKLPRLYLESACNGETFFALSEIPGITIDRRVPQLDHLTENAVDFLIEFNRITARVVPIDSDACDRLMGAVVRGVAEGYPETDGIMENIGQHLRAAALGKSVTSVWLHGDYKLENLIIDPKTLAINGIIDWEHSRREGLPWLDLLYLLAYNRIMTEKRDFFDVYRDMLLAGRLTDREKSLVARYAAAMPVTPPMREILNGLFFAHHIGFRYKYNMEMEGDRRNIFAVLDEIEKRLARLIQE